MNEFMTWLASQSPAWVLMIFPLLIGWGLVSVCNDIRKEKQLEANPHRMDGEEYEQHNRNRFRKQ